MSLGLKVEYIECFLNFCYLSKFFSFSEMAKVCQTQIKFSWKTNSAGNLPEIVFGLGVILYRVRNCWILLSSLSRPLFFFNALLNVSTNLLASPFNLGWYGGVVTCSTDNDLQKFLNSLSVNWVLLSQTIFSGTPKWENSFNTKIVVVAVGSPALKNFRSFCVTVHNYQIIKSI